MNLGAFGFRRVDWIPVVVALLASSCFAWMVPLGANPDESAHFDLVRLIARDRRLIVFVPPAGRAPLPEHVAANIARETGWRELPEGEPSRDEAHQPPLYYAIAATVRGLAGDATAPLRWLSVLFQCATVLWVAVGLRGLFPERPWIAAGSAGLVAVLPVAAQLGGAISNDALAHFLAAGFGLGCARIAAQGLDRGSAIRLGAVFGAGLLAKSTVLQLIPLLLLAGAIALRREPSTRTRTLGGIAIVLLVGLAIASPWLMRNSQLYGDPLARTIYAATGPNFAPMAIREIAGWSVLDYIRQVGVRTFATIFYFLDPNLPFNRFTGPQIPLAMVLLVTLGGALGAVRAWREGCVPKGERFAEALLAASPWMLVPFSIVFSMTVFQAQGRYLHPALTGIATVMVAGWSAWTPRRPWIGAMVPAVSMAVLTVLQMLGGGFVGGATMVGGSNG